MPELKLRDRVAIRASGLNGEIRGIWHRVDGEPLYRVQYVTTTKAVCSEWLAADQVDVFTEEQ